MIRKQFSFLDRKVSGLQEQNNQLPVRSFLNNFANTQIPQQSSCYEVEDIKSHRIKDRKKPQPQQGSGYAVQDIKSLRTKAAWLVEGFSPFNIERSFNKIQTTRPHQRVKTEIEDLIGGQTKQELVTKKIETIRSPTRNMNRSENIEPIGNQNGKVYSQMNFIQESQNKLRLTLKLGQIVQPKYQKYSRGNEFQ